MNNKNYNEKYENNFLESDKTDVLIAICGVGGGGGNAVKSIMDSLDTKNEFNIAQNSLNNIKFIAANTDAQALRSLKEPIINIQLGAALTKGFGAGGSPAIGEKSAIESKEEILRHLANNDLTFITCGMGGGTGTGAAPVIAQYLQEMRDEIVKQYGEHNEFANYLKVAVVTTPFHFEGQKKMQIAKRGIEEMKKYVDTLIVVPNQNLFRIANEKTTFRESFLKADEVLCNAIKCISGLITNAGLINVDFADVRYVLSKKGKAVIGIGSSSSGDDRAIEAALNAMSNPILDQVSFKKAKALLISITGGDDLTLFEIDAALNRISDEVDQDANIIFGSVYDPEKTGSLTVSVVATGIDDEEDEKENKNCLSEKNFNNSALFENQRESNYKKVFGVFNNEESSALKSSSTDKNHSSQENSYLENFQKNSPKLNNAYNEFELKNQKHNQISEESRNLNSLQNHHFDHSQFEKQNQNQNHLLQEKNFAHKGVDLVVNEKLQKLGIYNDLNGNQNSSTNNQTNLNYKNQAQNQNQQEKRFEYNNANIGMNNISSSQNQEMNYQESNKNFTKYENFHNKDSDFEKSETSKKKQPPSGGVFSRLISDIPAYLRKKKDK